VVECLLQRVAQFAGCQGEAGIIRIFGQNAEYLSRHKFERGFHSKRCFIRSR